MNKKMVFTGVLLILIAIILGAFGAHSLKTHISADKIASFEVGIRYQMYHGLALLIVGLQAGKIKFSMQFFYFLILFGTILFSASIYFLALQEMFDFSLRFLGPITPVGGALMVFGWLLFLIKIVLSKD